MTQSLNTSQAVSEKKLGRLKDLLTPVLRRHLKTEEQAQSLIECPSFVEGFDLLVKGLIGKLTKTFVVMIDYSRGLSEMISAGNYDYANENITDENFPVEYPVVVVTHDEETAKLFPQPNEFVTEIILVHFDREVTSDEALAELDKLGLRPANLPELLAFGETHPEVQREFPIIALGSIWARRDGFRYVPCLVDWVGRRELSLDWFDDYWYGLCRFAAVRK